MIETKAEVSKDLEKALKILDTQRVEDKLRRVILHDLEHGKQGRTGKIMGNEDKSKKIIKIL